ncbi:ADP-ribosylation factor family-domain-containing protein [Dipodascopsis tothii]|uniref:ADP-ribosylation factor family-domain-containing protein n=1 Tax=Dipodascopsis tothii TaxID=44089 RepID=UPI0034CD2858
MGLLTVLRKQKLKDRQVRVLMLGLDNAGKTSVVKAVLNQDVQEVAPTLGFAIKTLDLNGYKIDLWDVGGQSSLRPFWRNYFDKTDAIVWVVDAASLDRLDDCRRELARVLAEDRLQGATLLVLVNKTDTITDAADRDRAVAAVREALGIDAIANHACSVVPCSAYTGDGIKPAFAWLLDDIRRRLYVFD